MKKQLAAFAGILMLSMMTVSPAYAANTQYVYLSADPDGPAAPYYDNLKNVTLQDTVIQVTEPGVTVWSSMEADAVPLISAYGGLSYYYLGEENGYYKVRYDGGEGYIEKGYGVKQTNQIMMQEEMDVREKVIQAAYHYLGCRYVSGGTSEDGFDCSGFVQKVMADAGISVPRTTREQINAGTTIDASQIRPGDLLFYGPDEQSVNHVVMYCGDGVVIHAQGTGFGVTTQFWNDRHAPLRIVNLIGEQN